MITPSLRIPLDESTELLRQREAVRPSRVDPIAADIDRSNDFPATCGPACAFGLRHHRERVSGGSGIHLPRWWRWRP